MKKITKKNLHLVGSAGTIEQLESLAKERLYWSIFRTTPSDKYDSKLGAVCDVSNANGIITDMVVIVGKRTSLYEIIN